MLIGIFLTTQLTLLVPEVELLDSHTPYPMMKCIIQVEVLSRHDKY